ncbi:uncharacterized protein ARMOST_07214 [Armillaria ostoyae]|uniref:Uncharacterized protein n=1 Tax=Armillaria ostoyae TaxID=47428 RepID=A0A284R560_ARMOS|nr:uncharacterized protein ARMOST_07214 [Armillaria ostoyae]
MNGSLKSLKLLTGSGIRHSMSSGICYWFVLDQTPVNRSHGKPYVYWISFSSSAFSERLISAIKTTSFGSLESFGTRLEKLRSVWRSEEIHVSRTTVSMNCTRSKWQLKAFKVPRKEHRVMVEDEGIGR